MCLGIENLGPLGIVAGNYIPGPQTYLVPTDLWKDQRSTEKALSSIGIKEVLLQQFMSSF